MTKGPLTTNSIDLPEEITIKDLLNGASFLIEGLKYHHANFNRYTGPNGWCVEHNEESMNKAKHEATAYINRMGQIYYLAQNKIIKAKVGPPEKTIPKIKCFLPFRMKYAAHRAIDYPKGETPRVMRQLNGLFSTIYMVDNGHLIFYIMGEEGRKELVLDILKEHNDIMKEAQELLTKIEEDVSD